MRTLVDRGRQGTTSVPRPPVGIQGINGDPSGQLSSTHATNDPWQTNAASGRVIFQDGWCASPDARALWRLNLPIHSSPSYASVIQTLRPASTRRNPRGKSLPYLGDPSLSVLLQRE